MTQSFGDFGRGGGFDLDEVVERLPPSYILLVVEELEERGEVRFWDVVKRHVCKCKTDIGGRGRGGALEDFLSGSNGKRRLCMSVSSVSDVAHA